MSESAGMTLIETIIKMVAGFDGDNVSILKWGILNSGKARFYAILRPGPATRPQSGFGIRDNNYRTVVEVWYRFKDDGDGTGLIDKVDLLTAKLDQYPKLGDTTGTIRKEGGPVGLGEVMERWRNKGDGVSWVSRDIFVDWTQESEVSYAE